MTGPLDRLRAAAAEREAAGLRRALRTRAPGGPGGPLDPASNDYLGLSGNERLIEAAVHATREWGTGSTGSRLATGSTRLHADLEDRLAAFAGLAPRAAALCAELGAHVGCFRPPSVPHGRSCLRLTARADLRSDDLAVVRGALTAVAELTMLPELGDVAELRVDR